MTLNYVMHPIVKYHATILIINHFWVNRPLSGKGKAWQNRPLGLNTAYYSFGFLQ